MKLRTLTPTVRMLQVGMPATPAARKALEPQRIRGRRGMAMREATLVRDRYLCQRCRRAGRITEATQVDHILPLFAGGSDAEDNREGICDPCHLDKNAEDRAKYGPA